jgi:predicted alpha/beta superfamily hydrolase
MIVTSNERGPGDPMFLAVRNLRLSALVLCLILGADPGIAQSVIGGTVIDSASEMPLSYVNIGFRNKNLGTCSRADGSFALRITEEHVDDTLTFSSVGYLARSMPVSAFVTQGPVVIAMVATVMELDPVTIIGQKMVERRFGVTNSFAVLRFTDGSTNQDDVFEIAQLIRLGDQRSRITSVNLLVNGPRKDSATFRVNFHAYEDGRPGRRLVEQSIVQTHAIKEGWLKFDLTEHQIHLKGNFVVSLEFLPNPGKNEPIYYEVKIGGGSRSFVRHSSQGEWSVPPHHYKLHVTALVPEKKAKPMQDEQEADNDKETAATATLFSGSVKDTFHLFIHVPEDYAHHNDHSYPVIYLLDANVYFDIVADEMRRRGSRAILVGIGYKDFPMMDSLRTRDYTFPALPLEAGMPNSGGAPAFLSFIQDELMPYMNKAYRTEAYNNSLMGHSLGGYFTLFALEQALSGGVPHFKNYIAASPSLHYSDRYILHQFSVLYHPGSVGPCTLIMTMGAREDAEDGGMGTEMLDAFQLMVQALLDQAGTGVVLTEEVLPAMGHMETAIPTFTKALEMIFGRSKH